MLSEQTVRDLLAFRAARDWQQFHTPQNLAVAIAVEAGELLEHFQWMTAAERRPSPDRLPEMRSEVADLAILLSYLAHDLGFSLDDCVREKLALNDARYPVEKSRGNATKYNQL